MKYSWIASLVFFTFSLSFSFLAI
ncbi:cytochrome b6-f complex subunit PetN [Enterococcus faecium]